MAHEFSHAASPGRRRHTVAEKGYLAFDPRRYGDLGVSLVAAADRAPAGASASLAARSI